MEYTGEFWVFKNSVRPCVSPVSVVFLEFFDWCQKIRNYDEQDVINPTTTTLRLFRVSSQRRDF
jgi:hypothetical protein